MAPKRKRSTSSRAVKRRTIRASVRAEGGSVRARGSTVGRVFRYNMHTVEAFDQSRANTCNGLTTAGAPGPIALIAPGGVAGAGQISFTLGDMAGYLQYQAIYDFFRVRKCQFLLWEKQPASTAAIYDWNGAVGDVFPEGGYYHSCVIKTAEPTAVINIDKMREFETYKKTPIGRSGKDGRNVGFTFVPSCYLLDVAGQPNVEKPANEWIDFTASAVANTRFYGVYLLVQRFLGSNTLTYSPNIQWGFKVWLEFKSVR